MGTRKKNHKSKKGFRKTCSKRGGGEKCSSLVVVISTRLGRVLLIIRLKLLIRFYIILQYVLLLVLSFLDYLRRIAYI